MGDRTYWNQPGLDDPTAFSNNGDSFKEDILRDGSYPEDVFLAPDRELVPEFEANLVSSFTTSGKHKPVIDVDLPIAAVPSKTPGHFHLYIEKEMSWDQYEYLLGTLVDVGIVERNYLYAARQARMTFVRTRPELRPDRDAAEKLQLEVSAPFSAFGYGGRAW